MRALPCEPRPGARRRRVGTSTAAFQDPRGRRAPDDGVVATQRTQQDCKTHQTRGPNSRCSDQSRASAGPLSASRTRLADVPCGPLYKSTSYPNSNVRLRLLDETPKGVNANTRTNDFDAKRSTHESLAHPNQRPPSSSLIGGAHNATSRLTCSTSTCSTSATVPA
jgi:hypothetical protein